MDVRHIALIVRNSDASARRRLEGVARYAQRLPHWQLQLLDPGSPIPEEVDGIIAQIGNPELRARLRQAKVPVVDTFCQQADADFIGVSPDHNALGKTAAAYFVERGYSSFAYCGFCDSVFSGLRGTAYETAVVAAGGTCARFAEPEAVCSHAPLSHAADACRKSRALAKFLRALPRPTAVFCANDYMAFRVLRLAERLRLAVPEDLAVLGVGNDPLLCALARPSLSSLSSNAEGVGYTAARLLHAALRRTPAVRSHRVAHVAPGELVERASTAYRPVRGAAWLSALLVYIGQNLSAPLTTARLAARVGKSHTALDAAFRLNFGVSPGRYVLRVRMEAARRLLASGRLTAKEVASRTGFASQSYFSRTYRGWHGHPPAADMPAGAKAAVRR